MPIHADDDPKILGQFIQMAQQPRLQPAFVVQQRDRFRPLANMYQAGTESGLLVQLLVVEIDQSPPHPNGDPGANDRIQQCRPEQPRADHPEHAGKGDYRKESVHEHQDERKGHRGEGLHVIGNTLIGVLHSTLADQFIIQPVIGGRADVQAHELAGHELPPEQPQAFLAKAEDDGHDRGTGEYHHIIDSLADEGLDLAIRQGAHEVPPDITVDDIQAIDRQK